VTWLYDEGDGHEYGRGPSLHQIETGRVIRVEGRRPSDGHYVRVEGAPGPSYDWSGNWEGPTGAEFRAAVAECDAWIHHLGMIVGALDAETLEPLTVDA
jgi:hypothetical protein